MKFTLATIAFAASFALVNAQDLGDIPSCALTCFAAAVSGSGCSLSDTTCQCTTGRDSISQSVTGCVPGKCSDDDIAKITPAVEQICANKGITITDLPTAISSGSPSATGSGSRTASTTSSGTQTASGASASASNTGAAVANVAGLGAVAFGLAAAIGF
ncbi:hypothetical protein BDV96DRAFT_646077 [Lophiotrema nucula]|uniref:CFEM domain-containing protein n=1 Tax=Lophiotrema nucula TaxID=690887 RepID=A0A6A5Z8Y3_9PLEO|nr:hypothetical protein BDV96DRAFT_646077 [Lophiotrema nucula]